MARILVADDEPAISDLIKDLLSIGGHAVETVEDGAGALKLLGKRRFDLLILDRHMPGLSGIETLMKLKSVPNAKGMRVLMCTAADTLPDVDEALAAGADDYVAKPIDSKRLNEKVAKLAASSTVPPDEGGVKGVFGRLFG